MSQATAEMPAEPLGRPAAGHAGRARGRGWGREGGCVSACAALLHSSASVPSRGGRFQDVAQEGENILNSASPGGVLCASRTFSVLRCVALGGSVADSASRFWGQHRVVLIFLRVRAASFALSCNNRAIEDF